MSTVRELISAVINAQRQIDDQMTKLRAYSEEIDKVTKKVESTFNGSQQEYGKQMMQQLAQTKKQVDDAIGYLQTAKNKLTKVRMI